MQSKVAPFAATPDSTYGRLAPAPAHELVVEATEGAPEGESDLRLLIEEDPDTGAIVYKRIDRHTGEVIAQFPRETVLGMKDDARYVAGGVIRTRA
jgi:flagellar protein FlaG